MNKIKVQHKKKLKEICVKEGWILNMFVLFYMCVSLSKWRLNWKKTDSFEINYNLKYKLKMVNSYLTLSMCNLIRIEFSSYF